MVIQKPMSCKLSCHVVVLRRAETPMRIKSIELNAESRNEGRHFELAELAEVFRHG